MKFAGIHDLAVNLKKVDLNIVAQRALKPLAGEIAELNRDQLRKGQSASGLTLPNYSKVSVAKFGKPPGPIKLKEKGDYYGAIVAEFSSRNFTLKDTDQKADMLQKRYDQYGELINLSDSSIGDLAQEALGQIQFEIRKQL